jgi:non-specific serine/threonine protein kinase/serine/threonine-protein kinase
MDHPNIAKVLDGGVTQDRRPFFVMELVDGLPLTRFCDQAKLGIRDRLDLFVPTCQAVQHAHHKDIIHRDLKPSTLRVTLLDGRPVPKVIEFGVAKATSSRLSLAKDYGQHWRKDRRSGREGLRENKVDDRQVVIQASRLPFPHWQAGSLDRN